MKGICTIYYTSDIHGYLFPTNYLSTESLPLGLLAATPLFNKDGNTLILDGGDSLQGSPMLHMLRDQIHCRFPMIDVMNSIGYDYITLGNHDFNYGYAGVKQYLDRLEAQCVCANVIDTRGELPLFSHAIKTLENGLVIGIVGITTDFTPRWEPEENLKGFEFKDTFESAKHWVLQLRDRVDILLGIYHGGYECNPYTGVSLSNSGEDIACRLCRELNFDILFTGHQHVHVGGVFIGGTFTVQPIAMAREVCRLEVKVGELNELSIQEQWLYPNPDDAQASEELLQVEQYVQERLDEVVVLLPQSLHFPPRLEQAIQGSTLADFINRVQCEASGADLSATCLYNIPTQWPEGITVREILRAYQFPNTLKVLKISGGDLIRSMEQSASYLMRSTDGIVTYSPSFVSHERDHYNYDYFWGVEYQFDLNRPVGRRLLYCRVNGTDVRIDQNFTIALNSYRASGGGGYPWYKRSVVVFDSQEEIQTLMAQYLQTYGFEEKGRNSSIFI